MNIEIYYEPRTKFNKRIQPIEHKIFFSRIIRNWTKDITLESVISNLDEDFETCVITLEDCSGINSHVFENIDNIVSIFESYSV